MSKSESAVLIRALVLAGGGIVSLLALGDEHSLIVKQDGSVWSAGYNEYGQLGDSSTADNFKFVQVSNHARAVSVGNEHSMVLKQDGSVWATGQNVHG